MIELIVERYCENCPKFEADVVVTNEHAWCNGENYTTEIYCANREKCNEQVEFLMKYFEEKKCQTM